MTGERLLDLGDVTLCAETFGDPAHPAVLLIHGACASMLWWDRALCERIAAGGRFVIRYDNRDTGRSTSFPPGRPGYALTDLARDAVGVLDALGVGRAHVVGRSMSGAIALVLAVDHPDRVASVTFVGTTPGGDDLPPMTAVLPEDLPDPADDAAVVRYVVDVLRGYAGGSRYFDEAAVREVAELDVARTADMAATLTNHFAMEFDGPVSGGFGDVAVPALVVHGALDPMFPLAHGEALCRAVPGARLLVLDGVGHDLPPACHAAVVDACERLWRC